jgi:hypothetical protein
MNTIEQAREYALYCQRSAEQWALSYAQGASSLQNSQWAYNRAEAAWQALEDLLDAA